MLSHTNDNDLSAEGAPQRYRFLGKVGAGGMADVFLGIQRGEQDFTRLVAIKRLHRMALDGETIAPVDPVRLFVDEARVVATLNHPHIVKVYELLPQIDNVLILMEYVDGETLQTIMADTVRSGLRIPLPIICRWVADAAEALHYAHNAVTLAGKPLNLQRRWKIMQNSMRNWQRHRK
jgi:eukaryotic-like serine/threonine-protein kinase